MILPNYLVIGAAKAGTTSLQAYLDQHPDIFVASRREPSFFAHEGETPSFCGPGDEDWKFVTDLDAYRRLFAGAGDCQAVGEISPRYLYFEKASERIARHVPQARLIAILRHPVDRAYSHFLMNRNRNCEPAATLPEAIALEAERTGRGWGWDWRYVGAGLYHEQLSRYYDRFPQERIRVFLYDDLTADTGAFFAELFSFLGVDPTVRPTTSTRYRAASQPRSYVLEGFARRPGSARTALKRMMPVGLRHGVKSLVMSWNARPPERLDPGLRRALFAEHFAKDCRRLESLIGRNLSEWGL